MVCQDLRQSDVLPVRITGDKIGSGINDTRLDHIISQHVSEQYGSIAVEQYLQLPSAKRAVIIDDFHKVSLNFRGKTNLARMLKQRFGTALLISSDELRIEELTNISAADAALWEFRQFAIMQFGFEKRTALVNKWERLGVDYEVEDDDLEARVSRSDRLISKIINYDILPSFPAFILILLQQQEAYARNPTQSTGAFGFLYESLITASLSSSTVSPT
jgi:hypothetical protein